jgi:hypothetical protein
MQFTDNPLWRVFYLNSGVHYVSRNHHPDKRVRCCGRSGTSFSTELAAGDFIVSTVGGVPYTLPVKTVEVMPS